MIWSKKKHLFACALYLLLANCSSKKIQEKQVQWRTECEQMMLKGADGVIKHHDCFSRCTQHYTHYCTNRCENALMEGNAKRKEVDKHCRSYLKPYMSKKCHHLCDLTHEELQEYRASYVQKIQEKLQEGSACGKWDKEDAFLSSRKKTDPLDDTVNAFREPILDKRQAKFDADRKRNNNNKILSNHAGEPEGLSNIFAAFGVAGEKQQRNNNTSIKNGRSLSSGKKHTPRDDDDGDEDEENDDASEDQENDQEQDPDQNAAQDDDEEEDAPDQWTKPRIKGYKPLKTFSLTGDAPFTTEALTRQTQQKAKANPLQSIHTLESEIINSRNTLEAAKDIRSLLKGVKGGP